jgi:ABC-type Fe3+ transport system substrate-binding protein
VKVPLDAAFEAARSALAIDDVRVALEANVNKNVDDYGRLLAEAERGHLPDVLVTPGVNHLYSPSFVRSVIDSGDCLDVAAFPMDARPESSFRDPLGRCTVIAANVTVMAVDRSQLRGRPIPRRWPDLLDPAWEVSVVMRGDGDGVTWCETTLLTWHSLLGARGLRTLRKAIRDGWHPAKIAKSMAAGKSDAPVVGVLPWVFAETLSAKRHIEIVWPEDGAVVSPVTMLVRRSASPSVRRVARWLAGPEVAEVFTAARFPTPHPEVPPGTPRGARYAWVGWDLLRSRDVPALIREVEGLFSS